MLNAPSRPNWSGIVVLKPRDTGALVDIFTLWVKELSFTWLGVVLLTIVPALLFGSGIVSFVVLAAAVVIGIPSVFFWSAIKGFESRGFRRLAIVFVVPALTLAYVNHVDKQIPQNAMPLIQAIESFRLETGRYPESLEALIPNHLAIFPDVRRSVIQPLTTYRITDGKPYLAIPSAMGDMFAQFEYNFETKVWKHYV